ncbi:nucleotide disphospho-sugar-binding domain-containing protein [Streptomyces sp. NPDC052396]|uniref:nucleotide disphospho-sugar-binding domain-containing protein n=1 Tax=Streptomyces sp. NPDC052396 TaxID=3365689 RepID=UPI0037D1D39E
MRVLMMSSPTASHFAAMSALGQALRSAGHEVLGLGRPDMAAGPLAAGLGVVTRGREIDINARISAYLPEGIRPAQAFGRAMFGRIETGWDAWIIDDREVLPEYLEFAREWRPDLVVSEEVDFAGAVVAGALGVPLVRHRWGVDPLSGPLTRLAAKLLGPMCRELGLPGLPEPDLILDPCPPGLQLPEAAPGRPMRYVPFNGAGVLPSWARRTGGRRRVCVSLGNQTLRLNGAGLFRQVIAACGRLPETEVLVTIGQRDRKLVGEAPANVRYVDPTPLTLFLADCDLLVHHGGAGTSMTATALGVPQLVLPQIGDQFHHAERLAAVGTALALDDPRDQDDPDQVRQAVLELLGDDRYPKAASVLRDAAAGMPSPVALVPELVELAAHS